VLRATTGLQGEHVGTRVYSAAAGGSFQSTPIEWNVPIHRGTGQAITLAVTLVQRRSRYRGTVLDARLASMPLPLLTCSGAKYLLWVCWASKLQRTPDDELAQAASWLEAVPRPLLFVLALSCILLGALMAGLTLGLMSLDLFQLELLAVSGANPEEKSAARAIAPLRAKGNQLLVTLLLTNTLANELLPLVLDTLFPGGYAALVLSVVSVVVFGEVLPQAVCSRYGLKVGAATAGFTRTLMTIFWPVAAPAAWMLDKMLGKELRTGYDRDRLKALIQMHGPAGVTRAATPAPGAAAAAGSGTVASPDAPDLEWAPVVAAGAERTELRIQEPSPGYASTSSTMPRASSTQAVRRDSPNVGSNAVADKSFGTSWERAASTGTERAPAVASDGGRPSGFSVLSADEASMLVGILELSSKTVFQIMTKADDVFCLSVDDCLDRRLLKRILRLGHSRIPIYDGCRDNIIAILLVKQLLLVDPNKALPIRAIIRRKKRSHKKKVVSPVYVSKQCNLLDLLNEFQVGRSHMAIVVESLEPPADHGTRRFLGIVTLEDIVEEMIKEEVLDETDVFVDNEHRQPLLIRGQDKKWHYSIPPELLASRKRNPHLIQYRDIDESAYADAVVITGGAITKSASVAASGQQRAANVTGTSKADEARSATSPRPSSWCTEQAVTNATPPGSPHALPETETLQLRTGAAEATMASSSSSSFSETLPERDVRRDASAHAEHGNASVQTREQDETRADSEGNTRAPHGQLRVQDPDQLRGTEPPLVPGATSSSSESDSSQQLRPETSSQPTTGVPPAEPACDSDSEAETDLEYDFEAGTYVEPKNLAWRNKPDRSKRASPGSPAAPGATPMAQKQ